MKREEIIKALEWCSELRLCVDCPMRADGYFSHSGNACRKALMENALALIKELTAENERLKKAYIEYEECTGLKQVRAATVREMQKIITANYAASKVHYAENEAPTITYQLTNWQLDQIAEEMIGGKI